MAIESEKKHLLGVTLEDFAAYCDEQNLPAYRAKQVFEWVYKHGGGDFSAMSNLSKPLRQQLAEHWMVTTAVPADRREATDHTLKLLLRWPDEATSECVLIPDDRRQTACISSQVGCPVRCVFCASGHGGLQRQLKAGEIVEQALTLARLSESQGQRLSHIVVMGIGEPLANYNNVIKAIRIINADWGLNIGARKITVSTVGLPKQIRQLAAEDIQINLAISLHAPTDELRQELIPWAKNTRIDELVQAVRDYFKATGREVTIEYLLLGGVNDKVEHAHRLVTLCRRMRCNVNLIRYNPVPGLDFQRPDSSATHWFVQQLRERGVNVHVRKSRGLDIDAACGQLRRSTGGAKGTAVRG
ncbi:MAG: 23S rRNA (adenine(2503)-C(2))-methyltransferase RlmN [Phycisphaerales bacterium]|nr:23S rRNA (adenine(2503)-C(2))-methyltransferase RlmN [Phycisphaerales bacterium]